MLTATVTSSALASLLDSAIVRQAIVISSLCIESFANLLGPVGERLEIYNTQPSLGLGNGKWLINVAHPRY